MLKRPDGTIPLIQLAPDWEQTFAAHQMDGDRANRDVALPPDLFSRLANGIAERVAQAIIAPVVRARYEVAADLGETARGAGGFGSTGKG